MEEEDELGVDMNIHTHFNNFRKLLCQVKYTSPPTVEECDTHLVEKAPLPAA